MNDDVKQEILAQLQRFSLCVVSTVDKDAKPESAIIGFSHTDQLEIVFGTSNQTRKYANLMANPHVAFAIGDTVAEIQYEGEIAEQDTEVSQEWLQQHLQRFPVAERFMNDPNQVWFKVKPSWIRLIVHAEQDRVEEVSFS